MININEHEIILASLKLKRDDLINQLSEIEHLITKTENNTDIYNNAVIKNNSTRKKRNSETTDLYWNKTKDIMLNNGSKLTSREILQELYKEFPEDFNKKEDRNNIALLSSILSVKVGEGILKKYKNDKEQSRFELLENLDYELEKFERDMLGKK